MRAVLGTLSIQNLGKDPFSSVQRGLRLRLRESHGLKDFLKKLCCILILDCSHEVGCADSELYVHEFAIRQTVAV